MLSKWDLILEWLPPNAKDAPIDSKSLPEKFTPHAKFTKNISSLKNLKLEDYDAYFVVGGMVFVRSS